MGLIYSSTPATTGGFTQTHSGSAGYFNFSQGIPWYKGRSQLATIPEFMRNPQLLENNLVINLKEGRANLMKILFEYAESNGVIEVPDVKPRWKVKINPHDRFYLKAGAYAISNNRTTFQLTTFARPTPAISNALGNPKVVGDIARLQAGDFIALMCSWVKSDRTAYSASGTYTAPAPFYAPKPEICKIISVDYNANTFVAERNWAGSQRTAASTLTGSFTVTTAATGSSTSYINTTDAFFVRLPRTVKEDDIDAKVWGGTPTWDENILKRSLKAWGSGYLAEVINSNTGNPSPAAEDKQMAIDAFYGDWEYDAIWGEKSEGWDAETGDWWGTTDGLLAKVPVGHYIGIVPISIGQIKTNPSYAMGSFDPIVFNKVFSEKVYVNTNGVQAGDYVCVCGSTFQMNFASMINLQTQNVPTIQSDWKVVGNRFQTSDGATIDFVPSDKMSLNGMKNVGIMFPKSAFRLMKLKNYPTDIVEVNNENPLKKNGFIHGVMGFRNDNVDSTWVFVLDNALGGNRDESSYSYAGQSLDYATAIQGVTMS